MEQPPRAPPALPDEIVEEILLRFPPDDPARLLRAALVCKPCCRIVAGGGFRHRFRQFHRTHPMLGLLCNTNQMTRFFPTSSFRPPHGGDQPFWHAMDARHGRILLHALGSRLGEPVVDRFVVWDPITGDLKELPTPGSTCIVAAGALRCSAPMVTPATTSAATAVLLRLSSLPLTTSRLKPLSTHRRLVHGANQFPHSCSTMDTWILGTPLAGGFTLLRGLDRHHPQVQFGLTGIACDRPTACNQLAICCARNYSGWSAGICRNREFQTSLVVEGVWP